MKTQIINRLSLLAIALFTCMNINSGSYKMFPAHSTINYSIKTISSEQKEDTKAVPHKQEDLPYLPQIEHNHEIDLCDFKHLEKRTLWRCIANRAFAILYHAIILMPVLGQSFTDIISMLKH